LRVAQWTGIGLVLSGLVVLGFVPYALFVTRVAAETAQSTLRQYLPVLSGGIAAPAHGGDRLARFRTPPVLPWPANLRLGTAIASLTIPAAGVSDDAVVQGTGEFQLESGPGHYPSSPLPGQPGNVSIAGHRTTWLRPFYNLQAAGPGSAITLRVGDVVYHYRVTRLFAVAPTDVKVVAPIRGWWLTLTTCNPRYSAAQRLVVRAKLVSSDLIEPASTPARTTPVPPVVVRVTWAPQTLPNVPPGVLVVWLVCAVALSIVAALFARRSRLWLVALVPAAWCVFEAYGAAARLIPGSW
jgi:sortase A